MLGPDQGKRREQQKGKGEVMFCHVDQGVGCARRCGFFSRSNTVSWIPNFVIGKFMVPVGQMRRMCRISTGGSELALMVQPDREEVAGKFTGWIERNDRRAS